MYMFASGTANADRMVIGHSPAWPNYGLMYSDATDIWHFVSVGQKNITIDPNSSLIGIGTSAPASALDVVSTTGGANVSVNTSNTSFGPEYRLKSSGANGREYRLGSGQTGNSGGLGNFYIYDANAGADRMVITGSGTVGIGTSSPNNSLMHLAGSSTVYNGIHFTMAGSGTGATDGFLVGPFTSNSTDLTLWNFEAGNIVLGTSSSQRVTIDAAGEVGIGTTTPSAILHTNNGRGSGYNVIINETGSSNYPCLAMRNSVPSNTGVALLATTTNQLNVGTLTFGWGPVNASAFNVTSDRTMKKEINTLGEKDYADYMQQIRNIESATYRYNWENNETREFPHVGFIAQSLPNTVTAKMNEKTDGTGRPTIGYNLSDMIGLSVMGIKAVDSKTTELEALLKKQQEQIDALQKQLAELKK